MGPNTELTDSNIMLKGTSTCSKIYLYQLFQVVLLMFLVINIYQLTKELKSNSGHLLLNP